MGDPFYKKRAAMVKRQIAARGVKDARVLDAMNTVARERFVPNDMQKYAYNDCPLPIGLEQTISQPYMVALMIELMELRPDDCVLEVGTGSGYAAAVGALLAREVYTVERHALLAERARRRLELEGYRNVHVLHGNGYHGWAEHAPYDAILVSAGGTEVPTALREQLAVGGRLVIPVGETPYHQQLLKVRRETEHRYDEEWLGAVAFVPLVDH